MNTLAMAADHLNSRGAGILGAAALVWFIGYKLSGRGRSRRRRRGQ